MNLFYAPGLNSEAAHTALSEEEAGHALRVLRMKKGDKIIFTDGKGMFYEGEIVSDQPKKCSARILRPVPDPAKRSFRLSIAIAPTKSTDRFEWFLEKATEIGCDAIIPIQCRHSERSAIKTERLNKVLVSAMKQCLKSQLPKLHELTDYMKFIESTKDIKDCKFICHIPELSEHQFPPQNPKGKSLQDLYKKGENALILIGPEGGFSNEEVALAEKNGFHILSLGNSRLRVETAGIVACSFMNGANTAE